MYCTKCGAVCADQDSFCGKCGTRLSTNQSQPYRYAKNQTTAKESNAPAKKSGGCGTFVFLFLAVIVVLGYLVSDEEPEKKTDAPEPAPFAAVQTQPVIDEPMWVLNLVEKDTAWFEKGPGGQEVIEYNSQGQPGVIYRYYMDGSIASMETRDYGTDGTYANRIVRYDTYGFRSAEEQYMPDNSLWLYISYENSYDSFGRPLALCSYNRVGKPLVLRHFNYLEDGGYEEVFEEFRGPIYEYDLQTNPGGETSIWYQSITQYDSNKNIVYQEINYQDGQPAY